MASPYLIKHHRIKGLHSHLIFSTNIVSVKVDFCTLTLQSKLSSKQWHTALSQSSWRWNRLTGTLSASSNNRKDLLQSFTIPACPPLQLFPKTERCYKTGNPPVEKSRKREQKKKNLVHFHRHISKKILMIQWQNDIIEWGNCLSGLWNLNKVK